MYVKALSKQLETMNAKMSCVRLHCISFEFILEVIDVEWCLYQRHLWTDKNAVADLKIYVLYSKIYFESILD